MAKQSAITTGTTTRSETADAVTVILFGVVAAVIVGILTVFRAMSTFRDDGIAWMIPIDQQPVSATVGSGASNIEGIATDVMVFAPDVSGVAVSAIVASIALTTLAALLVIACVMFVAWSFLRGRFFAAGTARAFDVIGWALAVSPFVIVMLENIGRNGVVAALDIAGSEPVHPVEFWAVMPIFAIGVAVGLVAVAFRRGIRLQRETEGLV